MSNPLLRTKLYIPAPQPGLVHRPRLLQQIDTGLSKRLTLISAPAGFGKTTLLSEWILTHQAPVSWLALEEADNDPFRFWTYFMAALQAVDDSLGSSALAFLDAEGQPAHLTQLNSFLTILLNDISSCAKSFALILDDFHHIHHPAIQEGIIFLIDHLPPVMHLIITCRADPPFPLARLRARGQMTELRVDDLRFTPEEALTFLNQTGKLNLSSEEIAALDTRTEGWVAGLQLAAISMQGRADAASFIQSFTGSHRFIMDYLVDEVLRSQPEGIQAFLLETSILDRFTGPLCEAVTGKNGGQGMLEHLEQANLFIIPLDNERRWYRYHHLFADLLRSRLKETAPERIPDLHQRASEWLEQNGLLPEAIHHALMMGNFHRAAHLIERTAETLRQGGEIATLTRWFSALPAEIRRSHPGLCLAYARALVDTAQNSLIESALEEAAYGLEQVMPPDDPAADPLRGQLAALNAHLGMSRHRFEQAIELSQRARQLLPADDSIWRSFVALNLAGAYRFTSNWAAACQTYLEASDLSQRSGDKVYALVALSMCGEVFEAMGHLHSAVQQFERVLQQAQALGIPGAPVTGYALTGLARAWYEWNDLEAAAHYAQLGLERSKKADIMDILLRGYLAQARIKQAQGDFHGALEALDAVEPAVHQMEAAGVAEWVNSTRAQVWLARGETGAAISWASAYRGSLHDTVLPSIAVVLAHVRIAQGQPDEAVSVLEHALQSTHAVGREGNAIQILAIKSLVHQAQSHQEEAFSTLTEALSLAEPEGYLRVFLDEGEPMRALLSDLRIEIETQSHGKPSSSQVKLLNYITRLLAAFPMSDYPRGKTADPRDIPISTLETLSEREREVLRLLASGLSRRDIANRDIVSINTVKTQIKSIYEKLDVHTLEEAISVARARRLL